MGGPKRKYTVGAGIDARPLSTCRLCASVLQFFLNIALLLDLTLNALCLGSPLETLSQRTARARRAGSKPAAVFCVVLTWIWKRLFRSKDPDHCEWSLAGNGSIGREIWHWSPDTPNPPPPPQER